MKKSRSQYRRIWTAASRSLHNHNEHCSSPSQEPATVSNLCEYSDRQTNVELHESSLKRSRRTVACVLNRDEDIGVGQDCALNASSDCCFDDVGDVGTIEDDSTGSESEDELPSESLRDGLAKWANEHLVKHNALDSLLTILKNNGHSDLPGSARSRLGTRRNVSVQVKSGMEYVYLSLPNELFQNLRNTPLPSLAQSISLKTP